MATKKKAIKIKTKSKPKTKSRAKPRPAGVMAFMCTTCGELHPTKAAADNCEVGKHTAKIRVFKCKKCKQMWITQRIAEHCCRTIDGWYPNPIPRDQPGD